ncbi:DinB family protein [Gloeothece citriformis PCC 7424]|uniref:DinB family protein n=1 Tax=Gloeothece citriformis (strain PCC 7424) TaxID=65393 RepID=B7KHT1_GLOC7|nr:DinB family protein [Gloeothece citriformis]ACK72028.1 DinB family protein [Gloeothece citriformis PCC 7424]
MLDLNYYRLMAEYNQWMNQRLYNICATIPDPERKQERGAFFKSIHGTLDHLLYGDRAWMCRFLNQPFSGNIQELLYSDFEDLRQEREKTDRQLIEWTNQLSTEWLAAPFNYQSKVYQKNRVLPAWMLVVHLFNHQTHHRGQLTALLSQLGYDYGVTDLPWMPYLDEVFNH